MLCTNLYLEFLYIYIYIYIYILYSNMGGMLGSMGGVLGSMGGMFGLQQVLRKCVKIYLVQSTVSTGGNHGLVVKVLDSKFEGCIYIYIYIYIYI